MIDSDNRLLMSESLKGMVPELEEDYSAINESFIIASMDFEAEYGNYYIVSGSVVGISLEGVRDVKIDVRTGMKEAYDTIKKYTETGLSCRMLYLHLGNDEIFYQGPYRVSNPKILDIDHQNRMCTLGIDLIKIVE